MRGWASAQRSARSRASCHPRPGGAGQHDLALGVAGHADEPEAVRGRGDRHGQGAVALDARGQAALPGVEAQDREEHAGAAGRVEQRQDAVGLAGVAAAEAPHVGAGARGGRAGLGLGLRPVGAHRAQPFLQGGELRAPDGPALAGGAAARVEQPEACGLLELPPPAVEARGAQRHEGHRGGVGPGRVPEEGERRHRHDGTPARPTPGTPRSAKPCGRCRRRAREPTSSS